MKIKILITIILISILLGCSEDTQDTHSNNEELKKIDKSLYKDGEYKGTGLGYGGKINLKILIEKGEITEIILGKHNEDAPYMKDAIKILDDIIEFQSLDIDDVSGATDTCVGMRSAIRRALSKSEKDNL